MRSKKSCKIYGGLLLTVERYRGLYLLNRFKFSVRKGETT